jgi:hypothetical protein
MSRKEALDVFLRQTAGDTRRFGEIAATRGYVTKRDVRRVRRRLTIAHPRLRQPGELSLRLCRWW